MTEDTSTLGGFHPLIAEWFSRRFVHPTEIQRLVWPAIRRGGHLLMSAPTGSGKTLAAFLWGVNCLISGVWETGATRILYVSPLKALNNDIRVNLLQPLSELSALFEGEGLDMPGIRVLTRSGDTPSSERQRMIRRPPEILITTPESLNLMLSSPKGRDLFPGVRSVILDEIHAVLANKRGTHLITAVDRLVRLAGEFQRIALSATVRDPGAAAEFIGGYRIVSSGGEIRYEKRDVEVFQAIGTKTYRIAVRSAVRDLPGDDGGGDSPPAGTVSGGSGQGTAGGEAPTTARDAWWRGVTDSLKSIVRAHRSTLIFTNTRRLAEKLTRLVNEGEDVPLAYAHHGSLSREIRGLVEKRLKEGQLRAIVATSSLELGIDIGALDRVVMVETPFTVSSALQKLGRAGHGVDEVSEGDMFPLHAKDFLRAAVMARSVAEGDIEHARIPDCPLDVLAQIIVSMVGIEPWKREDLFHLLRSSSPYHALDRRRFDLVLDMLAGRYEDSRIRELKPRVFLEREEGTVSGKEGILRLVYLAGGTIPDRGYFALRHAGSRSLLGELDEEFVWERSIGDRFVLGSQSWRIVSIDDRDVEVVPSKVRASFTPFWKGEGIGRDFHFSRRIGETLEELSGIGDSAGRVHLLRSKYLMDDPAARKLDAYLARQIEATGLPHRHLVLAEHLYDTPGGEEGVQVVLHTHWGGAVNKPFSIALHGALEERRGNRVRVTHDDDGILVTLPEDVEGGVLMGLVTVENLQDLLGRKLEKTGFFGARFRENAARALLLPKASFDRRMPLWYTRLRAKRLMERVSSYGDFPILAETWRSCLRDEFDVTSLRLLLDELDRGVLRVRDAYPEKPSPFAEEILWWETAEHVYGDDTPTISGPTMLDRDIVEQVLQSTDLRPKLEERIIEDFLGRIHRVSPGYTPADAGELIELVRERLLVPEEELRELLRAMGGSSPPGHVLEEIGQSVVGMVVPGAAITSFATVDSVPRLLKAFSALYARTHHTAPMEYVLEEWLRYYGPVTRGFIGEVFGFAGKTLDALLLSLRERRCLIIDRLTEGGVEDEICDRENLEILLRRTRRARRPAFAPLGIRLLPLFIARYQGLAGASQDSLTQSLERLIGYPADAASWEEEILPARTSAYEPRELDALLTGTDLLWFGWGRGKIGFRFRGEESLFGPESPDGGGEEKGGGEERGVPSGTPDPGSIFPDERGSYDFFDLQEHSGLSVGDLYRTLWELVWSGLVSCDRFAPLRRGLAARFDPDRALARHRHTMRRDRWSRALPMPGNWFILKTAPRGLDDIERMEVSRDRIRQLLLRYGILFRELLEAEPEPLRWRNIVRTLRLMELSGEILAGYFFEGIRGLQFMHPEAYRMLADDFAGQSGGDAPFWISAVDPASLCGVRIEGVELGLPRRVAGSHIVYRGERILLLSRKNGRELDVRISPDDSDMVHCMAVFDHLLSRKVRPLTSVHVDIVNGKGALESPYAHRFMEFGFTRGHRDLILGRSYR